MLHIGINALGIGILTAICLTLTLLLDVPAGIVADKWSRKGMLIFAMLAMIICSIVLGSSHNIYIYGIGYALYALYLVGTNGTYQAIMYDSLHELCESKRYSKEMGWAYALFLVGAAVANVFSGFIAHRFGYSSTYYLSVIPCLINLIVIISMLEPKFHKPENKQAFIFKIRDASYEILKVRLLFGLAVVESTMAIVEIFKTDFGQLYMLRYFSEPQIIGLLWAAYALTWSLGSLIAHRLHARMNALILLSAIPLIIMSFWDSKWSLVLFMLQAVAAAAMFNQIETKIQDATPSHVRTSVFSLLSSVGRLLAIPASIVLGLVIHKHSIITALQLVTVVASITLVFWVIVRRGVKEEGLKSV